MKKKPKTFDCIAMKREGALRIYERTKNMTFEEEVEYWRKRNVEFRREQEELRKKKR